MRAKATPANDDARSLRKARNDSKVIALPSARDNDNARTQPQPITASDEVPRIGTRANGGRGRPAGDKNVPRIRKRKFPKVARALWPEKTSAQLAAIAGVDERTGKRWLEGRGDPPIEVAIACLQEMFREQE